MSLLLIANPGSASRKYALVDDKLKEVAALHIEQSGSELIATLRTGGDTRQVPLGFADISQSAAHLYGIFNSDSSYDFISDSTFSINWCSIWSFISRDWSKNG